MQQTAYKKINRWLKKHFFIPSFFLLGLTLPWQLGKHFWLDFSYLNGLRIDYLAPTIYLSDLVLGGLLLILFVTSKRQSIKVKKPSALGLGFILILIINFLVAQQPGLYFYRLYQYTKLGALIVLFSHSRQDQIKVFFSGITLSAILALILATSQILHQSSIGGIWYYLGERSFTLNSPGISTVSINGQKLLRAYAFFSHPNSLAGFFLPLVFIFFKLKKPLGAIITIILIVLAFSRFHLVLLGLGLLLFFVKRKKTCLLCTISQTLFVLWLIWLAWILKNDSISLSSRLTSIWPALQYIRQHPLGTGLGHYLEPRLPPFPQPVHNVFLLLTIEWGWLIWFFLYKLSQKLISSAKKNQLVRLLILLLVLMACFDHYLITLNQNLMLLGVVLGLFIGPWSKKQILN